MRTQPMSVSRCPIGTPRQSRQLIAIRLSDWNFRINDPPRPLRTIQYFVFTTRASGQAAGIRLCLISERGVPGGPWSTASSGNAAQDLPTQPDAPSGRTCHSECTNAMNNSAVKQRGRRYRSGTLVIKVSHGVKLRSARCDSAHVRERIMLRAKVRRFIIVIIAIATVGIFSAAPAQAANDDKWCSRTIGTCWAGPINANSVGHFIVIYGWSDACAQVDAYDYDNGVHVGNTLFACSGNVEEETIVGLYGRYRIRLDGALFYVRTGGLRNYCPCET